MTESAVETSPRRRLLILVALVALLAVGGWWWVRAQSAAIPFPTDTMEDEVRSAILEARQAVQESPNHAPAWGRLAMVLMAHDFAAEAKICFAQAAKLDPNDPTWPYGLALIAQKNDPDREIAWLRQAVAIAESWPDLHPAMCMLLAEVLMEHGDHDEAESLFATVRKNAPNQPRAVLGLGLIAATRGDTARAESLLQIVRAHPSASKLATSQLALLARQRGDAKAARAFEAEAASMPNDRSWPDPLRDAAAAMKVGRFVRDRQAHQLELAGRFDEAAKIFLKQIETDPTPNDYVGAGYNLAQLRDYERALPLLRKAVQLDPNNYKTHYTLALALFQRAEQRRNAKRDDAQAKKEFLEAIEQARIAAARKSDDADLYLIWGMSLKYLGDPGAAGVLLKGIAVQPTSFELQFSLANTYADLGNVNDAATHLEIARRLNAADPRLLALTERLKLKR